MTTLFATRLAVGASALLYPRICGSLFGIPFDPKTAIFARLFGARDLIFGGLCLQARGNPTQNGGGKDASMQSKGDLRTLLLVGLLLDTVDVSSSVIGWWKGEMGVEALGWVGGGAFAAVVLGVLGLKGL